MGGLVVRAGDPVGERILIFVKVVSLFPLRNV